MLTSKLFTERIMHGLVQYNILPGRLFTYVYMHLHGCTSRNHAVRVTRGMWFATIGLAWV